MSTTSFIPEIWDANILFAFRENAVAANLVNRQYEGDAQLGNKVTVNTGGAVTVYDYSIGEANGGTSGSPKARTTAADAVATTSADLSIDQEKNFDFYVDDIDRRQAAGSFDGFTRDAGLGLAEDADKYILSQMVSSAGKTIKGDQATTPAQITNQSDFQNVLRDLRKILNKKHVPKSNRVLFVNAEFEAGLLAAGGGLVELDKSQMPQALAEGTLGRLYGFQIVATENLPDTDNAACVALYQPSFSFVSQLTKTEALRANDKFADRVRGLHVYGAKAFRTDGIAAWTNKVS